MPLMAQEEGDDATRLDTITVTGSRIKRADVEGALPVVVIDRAQIEASGTISVADFLRDTTFNSFGAYMSSSGSSGLGATQVSMRGLGAARTLILIDGRRAPVAPQLGQGQDLNSIPLAAVERFEILSDGAS
ncbi:MAG: TonB-dependent receptor plug domain-containing protein, partial [Lysobacteraceae bacterium]